MSKTTVRKSKTVASEKAQPGSLHPVVRRSFETFHKLDSWRESQLTAKEPWCFNGGVGIWKYRITVEEIEEPREVLEARLRKLWRECDNHHHWQPLQAVAKQLGIVLTHEERRAPNDQTERSAGNAGRSQPKETNGL